MHPCSTRGCFTATSSWSLICDAYRAITDNANTRLLSDEVEWLMDLTGQPWQNLKNDTTNKKHFHSGTGQSPPSMFRFHETYTNAPQLTFNIAGKLQVGSTPVLYPKDMLDSLKKNWQSNTNQQSPTNRIDSTEGTIDHRCVNEESTRVQ